MNIIDALAKSPVVGSALARLEGGLQWFSENIGSTEFKLNAYHFLDGMRNLVPIVKKLIEFSANAIRLGIMGYNTAEPYVASTFNSVRSVITGLEARVDKAVPFLAAPLPGSNSGSRIGCGSTSPRPRHGLKVSRLQTRHPLCR